MRSNGLWLLILLAVVALGGWLLSMKSSPGSSPPSPVVTAAAHDFPSLDLSSTEGLLPGDKGYADVRSLTNPYKADSDAAAEGKLLFQSNCSSCHGPKGLGDGPAGVALNPKPDNLSQVKSYQHGPGDVGIFRTIKYGVDGTGMAPWEGRMTDEETWKVTQYVRCLQVNP